MKWINLEPFIPWIQNFTPSIFRNIFQHSTFLKNEKLYSDLWECFWFSITRFFRRFGIKIEKGIEDKQMLIFNRFFSILTRDEFIKIFWSLSFLRKSEWQEIWNLLKCPTQIFLAWKTWRSGIALTESVQENGLLYTSKMCPFYVM